MSTFRGVSRNTNGGRRGWQARSYANGSAKWLGNFLTKEAAREAVLRFEEGRRIEKAADPSDNIYDPILPSQYSSNGEKSPPLISELSLRVAILQQAKKDLLSPSPLIRNPARDWVLGLVKSPETFSFKEICDLCEADTKAARKSILLTQGLHGI